MLGNESTRYNRISVSDGDEKKEIMEAKGRVGNRI